MGPIADPSGLRFSLWQFQGGVCEPGDDPSHHAGGGTWPLTEQQLDRCTIACRFVGSCLGAGYLHGPIVIMTSNGTLQLTPRRDISSGHKLFWMKF